MNHQPPLLVAILAVAALALTATPTLADTPTHLDEDFTTTAHRDASHTTAVWDTAAGEIRLRATVDESINAAREHLEGR